jgi:hypothetical protein
VLFLSIAWRSNLEITISISMPDQLFTYYVENPFMIILINSGSWDRFNGIRVDIDFGELVNVALV